MKNKILFKIYIILTGSAISSVGILHLLRIIYRVPLVVGTLAIPMFFSYFGLIASVGITVLAVLCLIRVSNRGN